MNITKHNWGSIDGRKVCLFTLERSGLRAVVSNYGGVLQSLWVKDASGKELDVVLGYDTLEEYIRSDTFFGAMVGPIADRLGGGCCTVNGQICQFDRNAGPDCMHSGSAGFHARLWDWKILPDGIAFSLNFSNGELVLPGETDVQLVYRIPDDHTLRLEYRADCSCETAFSFTNHSYFSLNGGTDHCRNQLLAIHADHYAETERENDPICTGRALPVDGTPMDLRGGVHIADVLSKTDFSEICTGGGIDHYFLVNGSGMREHARLECAESGLRLICRSDAPGVLAYTANGLNAEPGKAGRIYGPNWAVCLETERFPNAVNLPHRRSSVLLQPGENYTSATEFVFERF